MPYEFDCVQILILLNVLQLLLLFKWDSEPYVCELSFLLNVLQLLWLDRINYTYHPCFYSLKTWNCHVIYSTTVNFNGIQWFGKCRHQMQKELKIKKSIYPSTLFQSHLGLCMFTMPLSLKVELSFSLILSQWVLAFVTSSNFVEVIENAW